MDNLATSTRLTDEIRQIPRRIYLKIVIYLKCIVDTLLFLRTLVKALLENLEPQSVLKISGAPKRIRASSSALTQKACSMVLKTRQDRFLRLCQSMIATRYINPRSMGI
jgi:hypothetical protein